MKIVSKVSIKTRKVKINLIRTTLLTVSARFPMNILKNVATITADVIKIPMLSIESPLSFRYRGINGQEREKLNANKNLINVIT